ncbi:MAG: hypothetical protein WB709_08815 [Solirubrobacteraceae bacterium]
MSVVTALLMLALGCVSCGGSTASTARSASPAPLAMSVARHLCPQSLVRVNREMAPPRVLAKSATPVLVPGRPTGLLVCRFAALDNLGVPGALAGAVSVAREDVIRRLASEFDALRPMPRHASCPTFGGRSELFVFRYPASSTARVLLRMEGCIPITNGRIVRDGLGLHLAGGEVHWPDESLL